MLELIASLVLALTMSVASQPAEATVDNGMDASCPAPINPDEVVGELVPEPCESQDKPPVVRQRSPRR